MPLDTQKSKPSFNRLKLTMPEHASQDKGQQHGISPSRPREHDSSSSPQRPSYSPVTPTLDQASLVSQDSMDLPPAQWMDEAPESIPVSLDDNPDAIALRATLSILQIQRQQALKDMRELDKMKRAALEEPEQFVEDLQAGKLSQPPQDHVESDGLDETKKTSRFGQFPAAQNVVRAPPVEWAKYHIVGEPLDRMHRIQQQYPGSTEETLEGSARPQPHTIAAPYRPFVDKLQETGSRQRATEK